MSGAFRFLLNVVRGNYIFLYRKGGNDYMLNLKAKFYYCQFIMYEFYCKVRERIGKPVTNGDVKLYLYRLRAKEAYKNAM